MSAAEIADVAVIGAGPAGIAAALAAAEYGLRVTLLDERPVAGGQYLLPTAANTALTRAERMGGELLGRLETAKVDRRAGTTVWHIERGPKLWLFSNGEATTLQPRAVVLAAGAREQVIPFPGWTLPGVMTVGAAQLLARRHGVVPRGRVLLAGSGPLLLAAAAKLASLGAQVVAVLEASQPTTWLRHVGALRNQSERLVEGWRYLRTLQKAGAAYRFGQAVVAAGGERRARRVTVARLDPATGVPRPDGRYEEDIDTICVGFGLIPNVELAQLAGANLVYDAKKGGWTPRVDSNLSTSVAGLYAAGETVGVAGAAAAMLTGRLAGLAAAAHLGGVSAAEFEREKSKLDGARESEARFGGMLNTIFAPPPGLAAITTDSTLLCRCEEVTAGEVGAAIRQSPRPVTLDALKIWTRIGQGPCQGRTCGPLIGRIIAQELGCSLADAGVFSVRPPVSPVPLRALAAIQPAAEVSQ